MNILVTGSLGFIGHHLVTYLTTKDHKVIGIDNRDISESLLIEHRFEYSRCSNYRFHKYNILDLGLKKLLGDYKFDIVIHLAALPGVRGSFLQPNKYIETNIIGHQNILNYCAATRTPLIYASSSSVYGNSDDSFSQETNQTDSPISVYGATKKTCEMLSSIYSKRYNLPIVGLRFFTVYGQRGREDMAYWKFTQSILKDEPIKVYGDQKKIFRDFTYIEDILESIYLIADSNEKLTGHTVYNIGKGKPDSLHNLIETIEDEIGKKAKIQKMKRVFGDVIKTASNTSRFATDYGFTPSFSLKKGVKEYVRWHKKFNS